MANYSVLKAAVQAVVKTNGNQEITGANMQSTLISIINSLGTGYQFMGVATPSTSPGTPDYNVAYIGGAGTYANFGTSVTVPVGSIGVFKYNGSWTKEQIDILPKYTNRDGLNNSIDEMYITGYQDGYHFSHFVWNGSTIIAIIRDSANNIVLFANGVSATAGDIFIYTQNGVTVYLIVNSNTYTISPQNTEILDGALEITCNPKILEYLLSLKMPAMSVDNVPTLGSDNLVKSGGVEQQMIDIIGYYKYNENLVVNSSNYYLYIPIKIAAGETVTIKSSSDAVVGTYRVYGNEHEGNSIIQNLNQEVTYTPSGDIYRLLVYVVNCSVAGELNIEVTYDGDTLHNIVQKINNADTEPVRNSTKFVESGGLFNYTTIDRYVILETDSIIANSYMIFSPLDNRGNIASLTIADVNVYQVSSGDVIKLEFSGYMGSMLAWGTFSSDSISHSTMLTYGSRSSSADGTHIVEIDTDCYLAVTNYKVGTCKVSKRENVKVTDIAIENSQEIEEIKKNEIKAQTYYRYLLSADSIKIAFGYGDKDVVVSMAKHGGNSLFDFSSISTIAKSGIIGTAEETIIVSIGTDWHAPFQVAATSNINGDNINPSTGDYYTYFTGGNHQYNNTGRGSTPTARTTQLKFYSYGNEISDGSGYSNKLEIRWTNLVQGYNTTKADGTGREILQENHRMVFADKIEEYVELIPLENIVMETWYGFQYSGRSEASSPNTGPYAYTRFIGAANKQAALGIVSSGQKITTSIIGYGTSHMIKVSVDSACDLGDRYCLDGDQSGAFTSGANKTYFYIVKNKNMDNGDYYYLHGGWEFLPIS